MGAALNRTVCRIKRTIVTNNSNVLWAQTFGPSLLSLCWNSVRAFRDYGISRMVFQSPRRQTVTPPVPVNWHQLVDNIKSANDDSSLSNLRVAGTYASRSSEGHQVLRMQRRRQSLCSWPLGRESWMCKRCQTLLQKLDSWDVTSDKTEMWQPSRHGEQVQRPALGSDAHVVLLLQQHRLLQFCTVHKNVLTFAQSCLASAGAHHVSYFSKISTQVMIV